MGKSEADIHAAVIGVAAASPGCRSFFRRVLPATASANTGRAGVRSNWVTLAVFTVRATKVKDPLPDIAAHVMDAKAVWLLQPDRVRFESAVVSLPGNVVSCVPAAPVFCAPSVSTGILPFSFAGETKVSAGYGIQLLYEPAGIIPADTVDRAVLAAGLEARRVATHHIAPVTLGHFIFADIVIREADFVTRLFQEAALVRTLLEAATLDSGQLQSCRLFNGDVCTRGYDRDDKTDDTYDSAEIEGHLPSPVR